MRRYQTSKKYQLIHSRKGFPRRTRSKSKNLQESHHTNSSEGSNHSKASSTLRSPPPKRGQQGGILGINEPMNIDHTTQPPINNADATQDEAERLSTQCSVLSVNLTTRRFDSVLITSASTKALASTSSHLFNAPHAISTSHIQPLQAPLESHYNSYIESAGTITE